MKSVFAKLSFAALLTCATISSASAQKVSTSSEETSIWDSVTEIFSDIKQSAENAFRQDVTHHYGECVNGTRDWWDTYNFAGFDTGVLVGGSVSMGHPC